MIGCQNEYFVEGSGGSWALRNIINYDTVDFKDIPRRIFITSRHTYEIL